jgi:hypothetical protein
MFPIESTTNDSTRSSEFPPNDENGKFEVLGVHALEIPLGKTRIPLHAKQKSRNRRLATL